MNGQGLLSPVRPPLLCGRLSEQRRTFAGDGVREEEAE